ncbi:flagellar type III secretion system protein FliR, partial [Xanthomonas citri pv. citri]|nr:flagellar type III secretion system protein FliR [Xanthomonas citri pv. citri]
FLAVICFSTIDKPPSLEIDEHYMLLAFKEALVGLCLGLIAYMMIAAVQIAGSFIDFQMGFSIANVIDPQTGAQSPLIGQFIY